MSDSPDVHSVTISSPQVSILSKNDQVRTSTFGSTFPTVTDENNAATDTNAAGPPGENLSSTIEEEVTQAADVPPINLGASSTATSASEGTVNGKSTDITSSQKETATSTSTASGTPDTSPQGLSDGAVAGVAIACVVAGLAIGLVAAFILFRRRRKNTTFSPGFIALEPQHTESKNGPQVNVISSTHDAELGQFLLDATPDKEIQAELSSLSELIYQHVETYYHAPQVQTNSAEVAQCLVHNGYSPELSGLQIDAVAALCLAPKTSRAGLRHVLSHIIFRSLDFNSGGNFSMLPAAVATMAQANNSAENPDSPAISLARSRWRSLSALLLHPNPAERTPLPLSADEAPSKAHSLANELNKFLQLFVAQDSASRQDQTNHLQAVILECTRLGYVLLSQPGDWGFIFRSKTTSMDTIRRIVVCPGLERLSHNDGTRYGSPKEVAAPETMPL